VNEDKAVRYQRLKRRASIVSVVWTVILLGGLVAAGQHLRLRDAAERFLPAAPVLAYTAMLWLLHESGSLPLAFYSGVLLERRYGLSNERLSSWFGDQLKAYLLSLGLGGGAASLVYWFIRWSPERWWLSAGLVFAGLIVCLTNLAPVLILPIFYSVKPLDREGLRARLLSLAERAGARVVGVYEWGLAEKTRKANAALAGLGATRRILVSDTMLAEYPDDEIEVVLAHELAHHVHGDIWKGIVFESVLVLAGFYVASQVLRGFAASAGLRSVSDVAGMPLLLLAAGVVSLVTVPFAHAMSRAFERSADQFAVNLTRNPAAFISAMRRLSVQNLAEDQPSRLVEWLFYSHPPMRERIAAAESFEIPARSPGSVNR
jgi:STE24 endopeptidase